jgi:hypothetical protein
LAKTPTKPKGPAKRPQRAPKAERFEVIEYRDVEPEPEPGNWPVPQRMDEREIAARIRHDHFEQSIGAYWERFHAELAAAKPITDYIGLLSIHAVLIAAFSYCMKFLWVGPTDKLLFGAFIITCIWFQLLPKMTNANSACVRAVLLRFVRGLGLPHPDTIRSASLSVLWAGLVIVAENMVVVGIGGAGYAMMQVATEAAAEVDKSALPAKDGRPAKNGKSTRGER